jgi:hypothetical protein
MSADGFTQPVLAWTTDMSVTPKRFSGSLRVGWRLARRLRTPRGACLGHPNDGTDISDMLQDTPTNQTAANLRAAILVEVKKDVSVQSALVAVTTSADGKSTTIAVQAFGEFGSTTVTFQTLSDGTLATTVT